MYVSATEATPRATRRAWLGLGLLAFTSGLNVVSGVVAAVFMTLAAVCLAVLRRADRPAPVAATEQTEQTEATRGTSAGRRYPVRPSIVDRRCSALRRRLSLQSGPAAPRRTMSAASRVASSTSP